MNNTVENKKDKREKYTRTNEQIRGVDTVRIIGGDGKQLGVFRLQEALRMAQEQELDLVEINRNSNPPLCKIIDYGKFKYEEEKRQKEAKKNQTKIQLKEVSLRQNTDTHDIIVKAKAIKRMIDEGNKVKITVQMRGREALHPELTKNTVDELLSHIEKYTIDLPLKLEGKSAYMFIMK